MYIDTHCHIYLEEFDKDRDDMLQKAVTEGVTKFILPAIDSNTHEKLLLLAQKNAQILPMMGLHPCSVKEQYKDELNYVKQYLDKKSFVAVGEIGLDYYWDKSFINQQHEAFEVQVQWALEKELPIVIHSRDALDDCIRMIKKLQNGQLKGVFHCFSGSLEQANQIIDLGFYLGIGGVLTFKNAGLDKVVEQVDLAHLVLETDAPYLAPAPYRGKRNECSYLKLIAEKLAAIKNVQVNDIGRITTANAKKLFNL